MCKQNEENDITAREFILLGAMIVIMILSIVGLLNALTDIAQSDLWEMLTLDKIAEAFTNLLGKLAC